MSLLPASLSVLCLDLPGHGHSSHYPPGCMYHLMEDIVTLRRIVRHFNWKKVTFMGHSMGSACAFFYAAFFPLEVDKFIGFDILRPFCLDSEIFVKTAGSEIDKFLDTIQSEGNSPEYTVEELIERQFKASMGSVSRESSRILLTRGSYESKNQKGLVALTRDVRLKVWFLHRLPHEVLLELASRIKCKVVNIKARPGTPGYCEKQEHVEQTLSVLRASASSVESHEAPGTHHMHLNNPESVAHIVESFLYPQ